MLLRKLHASWFIGWLCLGFILGAGLCAFIPSYIFSENFWIVIAFSVALVCFLKRKIWMVLLVICAGGLFGLWRGSILKDDLKGYQKYYSQTIKVTGLVSQDASYGGRGDQRLNLTNVAIGGEPLKGKIWVSSGKADVKRGDTVVIEGKLNEGFGNLSASMYRAQITDITRPYPGDVARRTRDWFGEGIRNAIPEPQVNLGLGYLVGQKTALPPDLEEQIKIVGLTHVVVASGYNLTILVTFCRKLFLKVSKYFATLASSLMVMSFMLVTGLSPSMTRAGLVAGLGLLVWYYGRKTHPFVLLSFAAAITVLVNPSYVWGDLGWYLSFGSFIGVIVLAPLLHAYFWDSSQKTSLLRGLLIETSSAQIVTMPILLFSFGLFSLYALPANMLVLPFVPLAMLLTFFAGIGGLALPGVAEVVGLPATIILKYSTSVIEKMANMPNATSEIKFNILLMIASYIVIGATIYYLKQRTKYDFRGQDSIEKI